MSELNFIEEDASLIADHIFGCSSKIINISNIILILNLEGQWLIQNEIIAESRTMIIIDPAEKIFDQHSMINFIMNKCHQKDIYVKYNEIVEILEAEDFLYKFLFVFSLYEDQKDLMN